MNKFEDVEMLDIPQAEKKVEEEVEEEAYDQSSSSSTESLSEPSSEQNIDGNCIESSTASPPEPSLLNMASVAQASGGGDYPELLDWLNSDDELQFRYHKSSKKDSGLKPTAMYSAYINFINSNFKLVESLLSKLDYDEQVEDLSPPTIGVISTSQKTLNGPISRSKRIDAAFQDLVENLQKLLESTAEKGNAAEEEEQEEQKDKLSDVLLILKCIASTYFCADVRRRPEMVAEWVNSFDPQPPRELITEIMINQPRSYTHPLFWNGLVRKMVLRGLFQQVDEVLEHSNYIELRDMCNPLFSAIQDLKSLVSSYKSYCYKGQFMQWKILACEYRDSLSQLKREVTDWEGQDVNYGTVFGQIYDIACIITGLPKTIATCSDSWYEMYLALSLYQIRDNESVSHAFFKSAISEVPPSPLVTNAGVDFNLDDLTEGTFINAMEGRIMKVMETLFDLSPATASYVSLLMELKGYFKDYHLNNTTGKLLAPQKTISEYFLTRHAHDCLNLHDLVPVGIGLLGNGLIYQRPESTEVNRNTVAEFIPHYDIKSNDDLEWALTICADLQLVSTARDLYFQAGTQAFDDGFLYEALNNFVNCYDPLQVSGSTHLEGLHKIHFIVWDIIFTDCLVNNKPIRDDLLNNIVEQKLDMELHPVIQQCISPYAVLKEFYDSLNDSTVKASSKLSKIIHLLKFQYMPKKFCPLLLCQFLPFLATNQKLPLPDLIVGVELIDNYESEATEEEKEQGEYLYDYSTKVQEIDTQSEHDWRIGAEPIPPDVKSMLVLLRSRITAKVGKVFID
ncbi:uncharacterized protein LODBEIA_P35400 [Lodderomyces beijingensis]|uniref:Nuclear pore complex protein Nup85 n=1 Tax=Lodderomyces beijingensis TaxID=1775926 RepID=A0ABP0ZQX0_9ASCO